MEMEAALTVWKRYTSLGFRYITVLSDGDCGKAHGSLKEATIKKLTTYYQKAILRNKGDVNAMKTAIYATLLHSISTDAKPQHSECPAGENSWCFYQSAIVNGEKPNNHKLNVGTPINEKFLPKILPIYQRLASNELLERCIRCGTQNANERLHSMIWAKCPKEIFVNKRRVKRAVTEAVCEYYKDKVRTIVETQKALGEVTGGSTKQLATILDCRKQKFRKRRQNPSNKLALKLIKKEQYNARPHVANTVQDFSSSQHMQLLPWPACSPDMSPIQHVWDLVDRRLVRDPRPAASKDEL
ncbi:uncharacterized protein TNCV_4511231 [Trichonephila clavipes]|nr:uncharacterized protein TNCV_4511231 [Trichonephila clavipes]